MGTIRDNEGTSRGKQGQAGLGKNKLGKGRFPVPTFSLLMLLDPAFACYFFSLFFLLVITIPLLFSAYPSHFAFPQICLA